MHKQIIIVLERTSILNALLPLTCVLNTINKAFSLCLPNAFKSFGLAVLSSSERPVLQRCRSTPGHWGQRCALKGLKSRKRTLNPEEFMAPNI